MRANFTSSSIAALMSNGKAKGEVGAPFKTYVEEKIMESKLGRRLTNETTAKPTTWGDLCELYVFGKHLEMTWYVTNETRFNHKEYLWSGSPDGYRGDTVLDIKSPFTLKSFCQLVDCKNGEDLLKLNKDYFWQLVSNSILIEQETQTPITRACLLVFCPYYSELASLKELASTTEFISPNKTYWIDRCDDDELPYLLDNGYYNNVNIMEFDILQTWKDQLIERVKKADKMLKETLKTLREPLVLIEKDTGECYEVLPPVRKSTTCVEVK